MLNLIVGSIFGYYYPFNIAFDKNYFTLSNIILSGWVSFSAFGGLLWYGYMYYHWATNKQFNNKFIKLLWFLVIFFGSVTYLAGPILYNIFVIEMRISEKRGQLQL